MSKRLIVMVGSAVVLMGAAQSEATDARNALHSSGGRVGTGPVHFESLVGGENVLIYEEFTLGVSAYQAAVADLGWGATLVNDGAAFAAALTGPDIYTHVISAHQNSFGAGVWEDDLADWAMGHPGSPVIINDWRVNNPQPYLADLGFGYTGNTNLDGVYGLDGTLLAGLGSPFASPGWGIFSYGVTGPDIIADDDFFGTGKPMVAQNGCWFFNGFLSDTIADEDIAVDIVQRQLLCAAGAIRVYESEGGPFDISNDLPPTVITIDVPPDPAGSIISSVKEVVLLDFAHTWAGDLTITLEHAGVTVTLLDRPGVPESTFGDDADFDGSDYVWVDGGFVYDADEFDPTVPSDQAYGPIPPSALADFVGLDKTGLWTLTITDGASGDDGSIGGFRLVVNNEEDFEDCNENGIPDDIETMPLYDIDPDAQPAPDCEDAPYIAPGIEYEASSVTAESFGVDMEYFFCDLLVGVNDVFYKYVAAWDGPVFITVSGPPLKWLYGVYDDCPPTKECLLACETDHFSLIFEAEKGKTYWIRIAGQYFATGEFDLFMLGPDPLFNPTDCNGNGIPDECECLADINGDGVVDKIDVGLVLAALGTACNGCPEDVDGSGFVDETDAAIVINSQGPCPFPDDI